MARNHLKCFPTAMRRRGMVQFHPGSSSPGPNLAAPAPPPPAPLVEPGPAPARDDDPTSGSDLAA
jgi:hypothetical protein